MALDGTPVKAISDVAEMEVRAIREQRTYRRAMGVDKEAAVEAAAESIYERLTKMTLEEAIRAVPDQIGREIDALFQKAFIEMALSSGTARLERKARD